MRKRVTTAAAVVAAGSLVLAAAAVFGVRTEAGRGILLERGRAMLAERGMSLEGGTLGFRWDKTADLYNFTFCSPGLCVDAGSANVSLSPAFQRIELRGVCPRVMPQPQSAPEKNPAEKWMKAAFETKLTFATLRAESSADCALLKKNPLSLSVDNNERELVVVLESARGKTVLRRNGSEITLEASFDGGTLRGALQRDRKLSLELTAPALDGPVSFAGELDTSPAALSGKLSGAVAGDVRLLLEAVPRLHAENVVVSKYAALPVTGLKLDADLQLAGGRFCPVVRDISATIWNGNVSSKRFAVCELNTAQQFTYEGVDLAEITAQYAPKRLHVTGAMDGEASIVFTPELEARDGRFSAREPGGDLQYVDGSGALPEIAREALESFRYSRLDGTFTYVKGILQMAAKIEGKGLLLNTDRPVHVNVTWEENFGNLLDLMKIKGDVEKELESQGLL